MEWFLIILVVIVVISIFAASADNNEIERRKAHNKAVLEKLPNWQDYKTIEGQKSRYVFALDNAGRKIYYIDAKCTKEIPFEQIISVEVLEDNTLLSSKSTTRTVGGALLGGVLAGGAGLVVGGLSGDSKQKKKVSKLSVKIKLRDYSSPSFLIPCFDSFEFTGHKEIKTTDSLFGDFYKEELQNAQKIADYISIIIDDEDRQERQKSQINDSKPTECSLADELAKLAKLKDSGILSEEEFNAQKSKILNL